MNKICLTVCLLVTSIVAFYQNHAYAKSAAEWSDLCNSSHDANDSCVAIYEGLYSAIKEIPLYSNGKENWEKIYKIASKYQISHLKMSGSHIKDLRPISYFGTIESLDLRDTKSLDLSPLIDLNRLSSVAIKKHKGQDYSVLSKNKNLKYLFLQQPYGVIMAIETNGNQANRPKIYYLSGKEYNAMTTLYGLQDDSN